ncbi:hypothetical protein COCON_G00127310 [Conger conger]|uniref:Uncharacterized protein n=1 Tax=Conger conger TaxID=82655 RepID=A0A9Q1DD91_CONCO|nr:hypothetical protein COCON_G00127310 [Conger conger]
MLLRVVFDAALETEVCLRTVSPLIPLPFSLLVRQAVEMAVAAGRGSTHSLLVASIPVMGNLWRSQWNRGDSHTKKIM